jgi:hypothetical protein
MMYKFTVEMKYTQLAPSFFTFIFTSKSIYRYIRNTRFKEEEECCVMLLRIRKKERKGKWNENHWIEFRKIPNLLNMKFQFVVLCQVESNYMSTYFSTIPKISIIFSNFSAQIWLPLSHTQHTKHLILV